MKTSLAISANRRRTVSPVSSLAGIASAFWGSSYPNQTHVSEYKVVGISGGNEDLLQSIQGPKKLGYVASNVNYDWWSGVDYSDAIGTDMLLYTADGHEIRWTAYNQLLTNVGNAAFQAAFVNQVKAYMDAHNLDGVFVDNCIYGADEVGPLDRTTGLPVSGPYYNHSGVQVIATNADYHTLMLSFLQNAVGVLKAQGYYMQVNGARSSDNTGALTNSWVDSYYQWVNNVAVEYYMETPWSAPYPWRYEGNTDWYMNWLSWVQVHEHIESLGIDMAAFTHHPETTDPNYLQYARYTRASFLMGWSASHPFSAWTWQPQEMNVDFWNEISAIDTGLPIGARTMVSGAVWKRAFQKQTVYVNPTLAPVVADDITVPALDAVFVPISNPANPRTDQWFGLDSAFNKPIPSSPQISPFNAQIIAELQPQIPNGFSVPQDWNKYYLQPRNRDPVFYCAANQAMVPIKHDYPHTDFETIMCPMPDPASFSLAGHKDTGDSENYLLIMHPDGSTWEFYDVMPPGRQPYGYSDFGGDGTTPDPVPIDSYWHAGEITHYLAGSGINKGWNAGLGNQNFAGTDSGILESCGIIRLRDTEDTPVGGHWDHALNWSGWRVCPVDNTLGKPNFVYPATAGGDGYSGAGYSGDGCWPEGVRIFIDHAVNLETWGSLIGAPEYQKQLCRTLQVYGMIQCHGSTGQGDGDGFRAEFSANFPTGHKYPWQDENGYWLNDGAHSGNFYPSVMAVPPDLLPHLLVIDWDWWTGE